MKEVSFFEKNNDKCVIALGFFDAVHIGHVDVLSSCVDMATSFNVMPFAFTFLGNPADYFENKESCLLCNYKERLNKFSSLGIKGVLCAPCEKKFFDIEAIDFLNALRERFSVVGIVCGQDYTFGSGGKGSVSLLKSFCEENNISLKIVDEKKVDGEKIGSSLIKRLVSIGEMQKANYLLGYNFSISGVVEKGRGDGHKHVYPTINLPIPLGKVVPKSGVYLSNVVVQEKTYLSITNVGAHPTFNDDKFNVETFILDFDADLYGKEVSVEFIEYMREIVKFDTPNDLKAQITKDIAYARSKI